MADEPVASIPSEDDSDAIVYDSMPLSPGDVLLRQKFYERYAAQAEQMDALARQMITVELAVPGLFATILALLAGDKATVPVSGWIIAAFLAWLASGILTFVALFPRTYRVDTDMLQMDPEDEGDVLGIEDFFRRSASYKYRLLLASAILFWLGIIFALILLFSGSPSAT